MDKTSHELSMGENITQEGLEHVDLGVVGVERIVLHSPSAFAIDKTFGFNLSDISRSVDILYNIVFGLNYGMRPHEMKSNVNWRVPFLLRIFYSFVTVVSFCLDFYYFPELVFFFPM